MAEARALFIALEGIDGSGTSTQTGALSACLRDRGHEVHETCEPSRGPIGRMIRERLSTRCAAIDPAALALLFAADRLDHLSCEIEPALARGAVVISDRYVLSSLVYQSIECDGPWVQGINAQARWPDICALVSLPWDKAVARVTARQTTAGGEKERYDTPDLQRQLATGYQHAFETQRPGPIVHINGDRSIAAVTEDLLRLCVRKGL